VVRNTMSDATAPLIAIVDDDASVRMAMGGLVRSAGYRSVMFGSGAEFLARHRRYEVDCLLLDIEMPGMDGLYVQRRLAAMNFSFPIIVVTGCDGEHREMAQKQGAFAVLPKASNGEALLSVIHSALQCRRKQELEPSDLELEEPGE
jgi:FixJ family two-component response regulator